MNKRHMRGFLDPLSLGIVLSLLGTATVLTLHPKTTQDEGVQVSSNNQQVIQTQVTKQN